ncbi:hypothetical protein [Streptomyces sp. NPDC046727]|uniref:hypothetical protein n=1 Tax=Streptomyces sp. NPDC046727 TaxID=3155373 RepID=UPI003400430E
MKPYPESAVVVSAAVVLVPVSQTARWPGQEDLILPTMGRHKRSETNTETKPKTSLDVAIATAGAIGGMASGIMVAATSYPAVALTGGILSLALLPAIAATAHRRRVPRSPSRTSPSTGGRRRTAGRRRPRHRHRPAAPLDLPAWCHMNKVYAVAGSTWSPTLSVLRHSEQTTASWVAQAVRSGRS